MNWKPIESQNLTEADRLRKEIAELRDMLARANAEAQMLKECIVRMTIERMGIR